MVVIIAITITFASLSLSSRAVDERLATEAERLEALLKLAADEAVVQGEEIGLLVASDGYGFYHLENDRWTAYEAGPLRERLLPDGLSLQLAGGADEDFRLPLPDSEEGDDGEKKQAQPQILLLSSGEITPFVLRLRAGRLAVFYEAEGRITGQIGLKRIGDRAT